MSHLPCRLALLFFSFSGFGFALAASAAAQSFAEVEAQLDDYPTLAAIRLEASAQRDLARAAGALPDPVVSLGVNNLPVSDPAFDRFLPTNKAIGARQSIPDGLTRRARTAQGLAEASATDVRLAAERAGLRAQLITLLAERTALEERIALLAGQDARYAELSDVVEAELAGGQAIAFRLGEVDAERAALGDRRATLEGDLARVEADLTRLVGFVPEGTIVPEVVVTEWDGAAQAFYDVALTARGIERAEAGVDLARGAYRPDWGVGLTYQQRDGSADGATVPFPGDDWVSAQITLTVPLYASRSQAPGLRAARARKSAAEARLQAAARTARARYEALAAEARAASESASAIERQNAALAERVEATRTAYEAGYGGYAPVIDGQIAQLGLEADLAALRARRISAAARANSLLMASEGGVR